MALFIKVLSGPKQNQIFPLRKGFVIGRSEGDIVLPNDAKLSGRHAYVDLESDGLLYLVDNGSKNGIRLDGELRDRIPLRVGGKLLVGSYFYEITDQAPAPELAADGTKARRQKARSWHEVLISFAGQQLKKVENQTIAVSPLQPALVLDFIRGVQAETRWVLGYGPREAGQASFDLPIYEPSAPGICFEILPTPEGISFKTNHPEIVKLNGRSVSTELLRIADVIKINDTEIEVDFIE